MRSKQLPASPPRDWKIALRLFIANHNDPYQPVDLKTCYVFSQALAPLTIGTFHDGIRSMADQGQIELIPYTRSLATMPDGDIGMLRHGEVFYFVTKKS